MTDHPLVIDVTPSGGTTLVYHPDKQATDAEALSAALGSVQDDRRGGHVYPLWPDRRMAFRFLRWLFGSKGRVADWTRTWRCLWVVRLADTGQMLPGLHCSHTAAVEAEVAWILEHKETD